MKIRLLAGALLLATSSMANADPIVYTLTSVNYINDFFSPARDIGGALLPPPGSACITCGIGTATDDGFGNIDIDNVSWKLTSGSNSYTIAFSGATTLGLGGSLTKDLGHTCVDVPGSAVCAPASNKSGLGGDIFYTGLAQDGTTACTQCAVNVTVAGNVLSIQVKKKLSEATSGFGSTSGQAYTMVFTAVPVPGAVWLFGSALGLLGIRRFRQTA